MNLRKLFYSPNSKQTQAIRADVKTIMERCEVIANQEFKEQKENKKARDGRCPACRAKQDVIVDKIRQVEGKANISGRFYSGFGSVTGLIDVDTNAVNHCNACGNEWLKFKIKYVSKTDIIRVALKYLAEKIEYPESQKRFDWKADAITVFDNCHAEGIKLLVRKNLRYLSSMKRSNLRISKLRKFYPSIFDDEIKK